jgi:uncharacterized protein YndB with AHSA1/START domain
MEKNLVARASITIDAPVQKVWKALVDPAAIQEYMFGTNVQSDWTEGSLIVWKGEWQGRSYEDKGIILRLEPGRTLRYSHFSPLSGLPDVPASYHTVNIELSGEGGGTRLALTQDKNPTEEAREHSESNWRTMLGALKKFLER